MRHAALISLLLLTGCTTPVSISLLPEKKIPAPPNGAIQHFDVLSVTNNSYRGGQPTKEGFEYLKNVCGVTTILKLNTDKEGSDADAEMMGMTVIKIPIDLNEQLFGMEYAEGLDIEREIELHPTNLYIHCEHGEDRTGLASKIYNIRINKMSEDRATEDMLSHGFHKMLHGLWVESEQF